MKAKLVDGQIAKYPYTDADIRAEARAANISLPAAFTPEFYSGWGAVSVVESDLPLTAFTEVAEEGTPELQNGAWRQVWSVRNKTPEEIALNLSDLAKSARDSRDTLLAECDWVIVMSLEAGRTIPAEWATYRQALRDLPQQAGFPVTINWPVKP